MNMFFVKFSYGIKETSVLSSVVVIELFLGVEFLIFASSSSFNHLSVQNKGITDLLPITVLDGASGIGYHYV